MNYPTVKELVECDPNKVARQMGIYYFGSSDPLIGGVFYSIADWEEHRYANCVRFFQAEGKLFVENGTIHRMIPSEEIEAMEYCDTPIDLYDNVHCQIEITCEMDGVETDEDHTGLQIKAYQEGVNYSEEKVYSECLMWLRELAPSMAMDTDNMLNYGPIRESRPEHRIRGHIAENDDYYDINDPRRRGE